MRPLELSPSFSSSPYQGPAVYRREQTPDSLPPPHRGQQRNSYSGPPSADYYRQDYRQDYQHQQQVCSPGYDQQQQSIVEQHYEATYRQVDQQLEGAAQLVANRAISPQRPYPVRPKNRVSRDYQA